MKKRLALMPVYALLMSVVLVQENIYTQNMPPSVAWRKIDWAHYNPMGHHVTQVESGEDWWYTGKPVYDASSNLIGYVACGYTNTKLTPDNIDDYNLMVNWPSNCGPNVTYNMMVNECTDRQLNGIRRLADNYGQIAFLDVFGKQKWCYRINSNELLEVIPVSDGFIAVGTTNGITTERGLQQFYNPTISHHELFTNVICSTSTQKHVTVTKVDFNGNEIWSNIYGLIDGDAPVSDFDKYWGSAGAGLDIIENSATNLVVCGWDVPTNSIGQAIGPAQIFLLELNPLNGEILRKEPVNFTAWNSQNNFQPTDFIGTEITEIGTSLTYAIAGRVYYWGSPNESEELTNAFLYKVNNDFTPGSGWTNNPILFQDASTNPDPDILGKRNGNITDILYYAPASTIYVPVVQHCQECYAGGKYNKGELVLHGIDENTGNENLYHNFGVVQAFDLRAGVTATTDGKIAVVSSKKYLPGANYTNQDFLNAIDSSGMHDLLDPNNNCLAAIQDNGSIEGDGIRFWDTDVYVAKITPGGSVLWETTFGVDPNSNKSREPYPYDLKREECAFRIVSTPDNGLTIFGTNSFNFDDYYTVKLYSDCQANFIPAPTDIFDNVDNVYDAGINEIINTDKKVKGSIRVPSTHTLTIDGAKLEFLDSRRVGFPCKIVVEKGGKLIVKNGAELTSLQSCDKAMWDGIEVQGDQILAQTPTSNQGWVFVSNNSQINRAYHGISNFAKDAFGNIDWSKSGGGIIQVSNSKFVDNGHAIEYTGYEHLVLDAFGNLNPVNNRGYVLGCSFYTTDDFGNLGTVRDPYTFISMWRTRNVRIEGNTFTNNRASHSTTLSPEKWGTGILSLDAAYKVIPKCTSLTYPCTSSIPNTFNYLFQGIYLIDGANSTAVTVDGNIFNNNVYGVRLAGAHFTKIVNNTFNITDPGNSHSPDVFGIYADAAYGSRTENNTMNGIGPIGVNDRSIGTLSINTSNGTGGFEDYRNNYFNLETGSQTEGQNWNIRINCNQYHGNDVLTTSGIFMASGEITNLGSCSGGPTYPESNIFFGTCNGTDRFQVYINPDVNDIPDNIGYVKYNTYSPIPLGVNFSCFTPFVNFSTEWVNPINCPGLTLPTDGSNCPALYTNPPIVNRINAQTRFTLTTNAIAADKHLIDGGNTNEVLIYIAGNHSAGQLKNYLLARSPYLSDEVLISAIHKNLPPGHIKQILIANSSLTNKVLNVVNDAGLPNGIYNNIVSAQNGQGAMRDLLNKIQQEETQRIMAVSEIVYYYLDTNRVDSAILFLGNAKMGHEALCALVPIVGQRDTIKARKMLDTIQVAATAMQSVTETQRKGEDLTDFCTFHRKLLQIQSRVGSYFTMTKDEIDALQALADGNSLISSSANGILEFVKQISAYKGAVDYNFNQPHSLSVNPPTTDELEADITMNLYPNPAMEGFSVQLSRIPDASEKTTVYIYDMNGKMLNTSIWGNAQDYGWISTESWPAGIYVVSVNIGNRLLLYKKVIVAK